MSDLRVKIQKMIQSSIENLGYELLDLETISEKTRLRVVVYIDHIEGVTINDCVEVTKAISLIIDEDNLFDNSFNLEVSSPGLNRKLILKEHYDKYTGADISVKLKTKMGERKMYKGRLLERKDDRITIYENNQKINIQIDAIEICRLVPAFK